MPFDPSALVERMYGVKLVPSNNTADAFPKSGSWMLPMRRMTRSDDRTEFDA
jgi:hypothetical protein